MKYHVVSTSRTGHGAVFTALKDAREYAGHHPGSTIETFDKMPCRIPALKGITPPDTIIDSIEPTLKISIYTDGSALNNPGPGGYGVVISGGKEHLELSQGYRHTTNNRMEMMAVIKALEKFVDTPDQPIKIFSDSQYMLNGITKGWAKNWKKKGWKKSDGKPALNPDLWARLIDLVDKFSHLSFQWVRGHAGTALNERADALANGAAKNNNPIEDTGYTG